MTDLHPTHDEGYSLTVADAAAVLKVGKGAVREWTDQGLLPCWRTPGGHRRYRLADLVRFQSEAAA